MIAPTSPNTRRDIFNNPPTDLAANHAESVACGCCKKIVPESDVFQCCTCRELICDSARGCLRLCKCDRNIFGFIKQIVWFRWTVGNVYTLPISGFSHSASSPLKRTNS
jgi:hypothetical protein